MSKDSEEKAISYFDRTTGLSFPNGFEVRVGNKKLCIETAYKAIEIASEVPDCSELYNEFTTKIKNSKSMKDWRHYGSMRFLLRALASKGIITLKNIEL